MRIPIISETLKKIEPCSHQLNHTKNVHREKKGAAILPLRTSSSIEIEISPCRDRINIFFLLLLSWFPMLFYLIHIHSMMTAQLADQTLRVDLLKIEVQELMVEVTTLKSKSHLSLESHAPVPDPIDVEILLKEPFPYLPRQKRSVAEEVLNNVRRTVSPPRKAMAKTASRRGIRAIHFKGAYPEAIVEAGRVGPWYVDSKAITDSGVSSPFLLQGDGESVLIKETGVYFIYAQVYYLTTQAFNSFTILHLPKDSEVPVPIALCSSTINSISSTSEVSCYTAVVRTLEIGDHIFLQQREKHRRLIMRGGHTFLGFTKLAS